jgi:hypothetical protein
MPKTNAARKPVRSFRLSLEGNRQLRELAGEMGRSEGEVIEVALDRMYREEVRFGRLIHDGNRTEGSYHVKDNNEVN